MNITEEIAKHRKTGITIYIFSTSFDPFLRRYHQWMFDRHSARAARLAERGIGEFPGVDLKLTPYGPKILYHLNVAREHDGGEKGL